MIDTPNDKTLRSQIIKTFDELEALGLIRRTGAFRNGQPVYTVTERGRNANLASEGKLQ